MLWCAVLTPFMPALTVAVSRWALPAVGFATAAVPVVVLVYNAIADARTYRPALRVVEGGRTELKLTPA